MDVLPNLLPTFLAGRDCACPGCGYNLRDLRGTRCPECGDELVLQVGLMEPRQAGVIAGLIGLAAGAGMSGLLLGFLVILLVTRQAGGPDAGFVVVNLGGLVVEGTAIVIWLRNWRAIRRLKAGMTWVLVAACWGLTLTNLIVFSIFVR